MRIGAIVERVARRRRRAPRGAATRFAAGLALAVLAASAGPAGAQTAQAVRAAIETTQRAIDRAAGTLRCPPGAGGLGCTYYAQALTLQASARASFASGFLRDALALTNRAQGRVTQALGAGREPSAGDFVDFSLQRTDALLERVAPPVRAARVARAERRLDDARDWERRARRAAEGGRPRVALGATLKAREGALTALRLADAAAAVTPETARALLERTDDLLRAEAWLADAGGSAGPYARALELQGRARGRLESNQAKPAIALTLAARDALAHAFGRADRPLGRAAVERALSDNASALESARRRADHDPDARDRLARAEQHHRQAQEHFRAGHLALALAELHASREALTPAVR